MESNYNKAILEINPSAKFTYINDDINTIQWLEGTSPISISDIEAKKAEIDTAEANKSASETAKEKLRNLGFSEDEVALLIHE